MSEDRLARVEGDLSQLTKSTSELTGEIRELVVEVRRDREEYSGIKDRVKKLEEGQVNLRIEAQDWRSVAKTMDKVQTIILRALIAFILSGSGMVAVMGYIVSKVL